MINDRTILITGVTGNQGGAVAQALKGAGFHLRGLQRRYRWPGTRVRPQAHEAPRLGTSPRATKWRLMEGASPCPSHAAFFLAVRPSRFPPEA